MKKILCIDGGGVFGIIPASVLTAIEERTGRPSHQLFDMIVGTSIGGIIATGLAIPSDKNNGEPLTAKMTLDLIVDHGTEIFSRNLRDRIRNPFGIFGPKFSPAALEKYLAEYVGGAWLSAARCDLMTTTYDIAVRAPRFFKSWKALPGGPFAEPGDPGDRDFLAFDVCRCTSAAPTYFPPHRARSKSGVEWTGIDGGVFANNPSICAFASVREIYKGSDVDDVLLVSLGTGGSDEKLSYEAAIGWGPLKWVKHVISSMMDGSEDTADYQIQRILAKDNYYRFDVDYDELKIPADERPSDEFTDGSAENLRRLVAQGSALVDRESARLDALCGKLTA